jgi:hypothetical protein
MAVSIVEMQRDIEAAFYDGCCLALLDTFLKLDAETYGRVAGWAIGHWADTGLDRLDVSTVVWDRSVKYQLIYAVGFELSGNRCV